MCTEFSGNSYWNKKTSRTKLFGFFFIQNSGSIMVLSLAETHHDGVVVFLYIDLMLYV